MDFVSKEPINKGWSGDRKYKVTDKSGNTYLYRVAPAYKYERKKAEFEYMQEVARLNIPMCLPIECGQNEDGAYLLQSFIDGYDAEDAIIEMPKRQIYEYGIDAGETLKRIHSISAPLDAPDWESRFNAKIDRKLKAYAESPLKYENGEGELFIEYIETHRHLLKNRPQACHHGDYHIGNMMIGKDGKLYIIDFDKRDFGDPWEEFNRIVWCAQASPYFSSGMVDGYFDGQPPIDFWQLLALYISSNTLSSLPWAIPFGDMEIKTMRNQAKEVISWYNGMKTVVPSWYIKSYEI